MTPWLITMLKLNQQVVQKGKNYLLGAKKEPWTIEWAMHKHKLCLLAMDISIIPL
jgi:hypothetical protein